MNALGVLASVEALGGDLARAGPHRGARLGGAPQVVRVVVGSAQLRIGEPLEALGALAGPVVEVVTDRAGEVTELRPLNPHEVTVVKLPNGRHRYDVTTDGRVRSTVHAERR